jgi:glycosyltransferase involved in cell wall biosynthesis
MTKPLRICLIMQGGKDWMGGTEYIKNIILALGILPSNIRSTFELCLICSESVDASLYNQVQPYLHKIYCYEKYIKPLTLQSRIRWKALRSLFSQGNLWFDEIYKNENSLWFDKFFKHENIDFAYPFLSQNTQHKSYRSAAWIADFQHKHLPQFFTEEEIRQRDRIFSAIAKNSSTVILSSKDAETDFHRLYPEAINKTRVLSFKTSPLPLWYEGIPIAVQQEYSLPDRFFLISNQFWQHKNHMVVFEALKLLQAKSIYPAIVCTGYIYDYRKPDYFDHLLQTIHKLGVAKQVYILGLIPRLDQIQLMRRSAALVQPSLFEGWSTVVEDARCLGKSIVLSDFPVHLEQNPPYSVFFERCSPESLAAILADCWGKLSPGPDLTREATARINNYRDVQAFGDRFLDIAKSQKLV